MSTPTKLRAALKGAQLRASAPGEHVWLSASAGTGKTTVLAARVLRLLMRGVSPEAILCLTFTKAGAAEMARRVRGDLARWVRLDEATLFNEIDALGETAGPEDIAKARQLFARLLEARGGGLRVMTIHAFCQTLLSAFPIEAGLTPGFRPIEGREADTLAAATLSDLVMRNEREGGAFVRQLQGLSRRWGEDGARSFLNRGGKALPALEQLGPGLRAKLRTAFDVPLDFDASHICTACHDDNFDRASIEELRSMLTGWGTSRANERVTIIDAWLAQDETARATGLPALRRGWAKTDGALFEAKGWIPPRDDYRPLVDVIDSWCLELCEKQARANLADSVAEALEAARTYGRAYAEAKQARGRVDFDDLIRITRDLLGKPGIGDWIAYKTDQRTDHILVDEAQDTNFDQWDIVERLTEEFFAGEGQKGRRSRTLFTVGDFKQAIFSFQGTNPQEFANARERYHALAEANEMRFAQLSLDESYRTAQPILDVVDATLDALGPEAIGLRAERLNRHVSGRRDATGGVMLLAPVSLDDAGDEGDENWLDDATRKLADHIARQVSAWLRDGYAPGGGEALQPRDVMVLVRKRADLAALLVARLQEHGVPVAGVDRLRLRSPLAVKDLLAAMRFGAQPEDDLNLANLLVSPLIGWSQDDLYAAAYDRRGSLWSAVRDRGDAAAHARLLAWLNAADRVTPYLFLEELLSGEAQGRRRLIAQLGEDVRDAINELLGAVLAYEAEHVATLQGFIDWFDRGEGEIVRDASEPGNAARVMTVHGAKGLEARLVFLADACGDPEKGRDGELTIDLDGARVVIPTPPTADRALVTSLADAHAAQKAASLEEHWRLLYVAMTRARDQLVVAGALTGRMTAPPAQSWYAAVRAGMEALGSVDTEGDLAFGTQMSPGARSVEPRARATERPAWLDRPAPDEAKPRRPLAPSSLGTDADAQPPAGPAMAVAARRGTLLHGLFERLPSLPRERRVGTAQAWLASRGVAEEQERNALIDPVCAIIGDARFARLFSGEALVEAPIAGVVGGETVAGTVDRLVIGDAIEVVDYKTGRRVPSSPDAIPEYHLRQMAAYRDVLRAVFPGKAIRTSLLYTEGPTLHTLDDALLDAHKPDFTAAHQSLAIAG